MSEPSPTSIYLGSIYYPNVSIVSGIMALIVVLFMIIISIYDRKLVDRVSLRLQTGLSVYDVWLHGGALWRSISPAAPGVACTSRGYLALFFNILYAFLNVSIALNLQLIFIHNKTVTRWMEVGYWVVPITLSLLISIPPLAMGLLGYSKYYGCYIADSEYGLYYGKMLDFYANQIWRFLCLIYLIIAVTMVFIKLRKNLNFFKNNLNMESANSTQCINTIKLLGYRILLYPSIMIFCQFPGIISQFYYDLTDGESIALDQWSSIVLPFAGILNFLAFCIDPTVQSAIKAIYFRIKKRNSTSNEQTDTENNDNSIKLDTLDQVDDVNQRITNNFIKSL